MGVRFPLWAGAGCDVLGGTLADLQGRAGAPLGADLCAEQPLGGVASIVPLHYRSNV